MADNPDNPRPEDIIAAPSVIQRIEMLRGPLVDVVVGSRQKHYTLPSQLLRNTSQFFQDWLDKLERESKPFCLTINDIPNAIFKVLLEYMYDGKMSPAAIELQNIGVEGLQECRKIIKRAHRYGIGRAACVGVHDALMEIINVYFRSDQWIFDDHYSMISKVLHYRRYEGATRPSESHLHVYIIVNQEIPGHATHTQGLMDKLTILINKNRHEEPENTGQGWDPHP